jgi:hypothetical protein
MKTLKQTKGGKTMFKFDEEALVKSMAALSQSINQLAVVMAEAVQPLISSISELGWQLFNTIGWQRLPYETDEMYAERLVSHGWLDNPDARWEYQKIVLMTPVRVARRWFERWQTI